MKKNSWEKAVLDLSDTMAYAIEVLEENKSLGIGLVLGKDRKLIGTVTDGDIRRSLISRHRMDVSVEKIMNSNPIVAQIEDNNETIQRMMQESCLARVPVVDYDGRLVRVARDDVMVRGARVNNPVLLMAGGFGKRLHPLTLDKPKPLLVVGEKPILETILEQLADQGFHNIFISVHYKSQLVRDYFRDGRTWNVDIQYLEESRPLGTAGALGLLYEELGQNDSANPIIVINGDLVTRVEYAELLRFHQQHRGVATLCVREYDLKIPYGVVEADGMDLVRIVEKPVQTFFVNAGIYVIDRSVIQEVRTNHPKEMPDLLQQQIDQGKNVNLFPIHEYWRDVGGLSEYERAQEDAKSNI